MFSWKIKPGFYKAAGLGFLNSQAPLPDGLNLVGRWHGPGSAHGWLLVEADDLAPVHLHAAEWGDMLAIDVTPVVKDEVAGSSFQQVYG